MEAKNVSNPLPSEEIISLSDDNDNNSEQFSDIEEQPVTINQDSIDIKIVIAGLPQSGKTSFVNKWTNNTYNESNNNSSLCEIGFKTITINEIDYNICLWVLSSNEDNKIRIVGKDANGLIMLCDNTNQKSINELKRLKSKLIKVSNCSDVKRFPCLLLQNKVDLLLKENKNNYLNLKKIARDHNYFDALMISVKEDINVNKAMDIIINCILDKKSIDEMEITKEKISHSFQRNLTMIVIGNSKSGKSSFVQRYTKNVFKEEYKETIVSEFESKIVELDGELNRIQIWDLKSQDKYFSLTKILVKSAHAVIIVVDAKDDEKIIEEGLKWKSVIDSSSERLIDGGKIPCIIVKSKMDLFPKEEQDNSKLKELAEKNEFDGAFKISSKDNINIKETIEFAAGEVIKRMKAVEKEDTNKKEEIIEEQSTIGKFDKAFKLMIIGNSKVGKTSLFERYTKHFFIDIYKKTLLPELYIKMVGNNDKNYKFILWDFISKDDKTINLKSFASDASGMLIICDATDKQSLEESVKLKKIVDDSFTAVNKSKIPCVLVETKIDLVSKEEQLNDKELKEFAKVNGFDDVFRASAKDDININESVEALISLVMKKEEMLSQKNDNTNNINITQ